MLAFLDASRYPVYGPDGRTCDASEFHVSSVDEDGDLVFGSGRFLDKLKNEYQVRDGDIWVMTYPKTGTNWVTELLVNVLAKGDEEKLQALKMAMFQCGGFRPELLDYDGCKRPPALGSKTAAIDGAARVKEMNNPDVHQRMFSTHFKENQLPADVYKKNKVIIVMRNPKDTCVSYFHFHRMNKGLGQYEGSFSDFLHSFLNNGLMGGDWFNHTKSFWQKHRDNKNVLFFKYEDMKKNFPGALTRMSDFFGISLTDADKEKIAQNTSFNKMGKSFSNMLKHSGDETSCLDERISKFMRKGEIGDWKNHFTVAESEAFDRIYAEKMKGTDLTFEFE